MRGVQVLFACLLCGAGVSEACAGAPATGPAAEPAKVSALIVDGVNNHDWPRNTRILKAILLASGRFTVEVSTTPPTDAPAADWDRWRPDFRRYGVVVVNFNSGPGRGVQWPKEVRTAFEDYVSHGGGMVSYHAANNSFPDWAAYNEMIGLGWRDKKFGPSLIVSPDEKVVRVPAGEGLNPGHPAEHDFQVTVLDPAHPITRGMPKVWFHPNEQLTHGQHGPAKDVTVLTYAYAADTKENEVMDWVVPYGHGRVYVTMLGHLWKDGPDTALRCAGFQTLFTRGVEWAATGNVTLPIPEDFPSATRPSLRESTEPALEIRTKKKDDRVEAAPEEGKAVVTVTSPSGIGSALIRRTAARWPQPLVLRMNLKGLESLVISDGTDQLHVSAPSHGGGQTMESVGREGKEGPPISKESPYWTEVRAANGAFELAVPAALLNEKSQTLAVEWVDFHRD